MILFKAVLVLVCVSLSCGVRVLSWPALNCSTQGLRCSVTTSNCLDSEWLDVHEYTPSSPEGFQASVDTRWDETGHLQPVLMANWMIKDDGSIAALNATELHVLVLSTNMNLCVRYTFKDKLPMRSPSGDKWSFSANMLVLDPGQKYHVSVFNIPKPEMGHSIYDVSATVSVPGCLDPRMQMTQFCIERGSLWQPNISVAQIDTAGGRSALAVSFSPHSLCDEYIVIVKCSTIPQVERPFKGNQTTLTVSFSLDKWPRSCCQFDTQIKPLFPQCGQDCVRRKRTLDICPHEPTDAPKVPVNLYVFIVLGVVFVCVVTAVIMCILRRKQGKPVVPDPPVPPKIPWQQQLKQTPKVLVIYSQDHSLYRDVVLKLCAFLQAKCGTKVLVDLLDSTSVGMVGRLRWLEWQRQQLKNPSDKILVLCSQGVQAKWRAMCGQGRVILREDVLSPTDDMITPFLNLFLPDMYQAGMLGKYMVAYFNDISGEQDIPSVFDIGVKYKLMKHFEELYFRILDVEKYQPGQVNHIKGIGGDDYFDCPSGRDLKNAIETFQAYQLENPDWFEKECVASEEEVRNKANLVIDQLQIPPVLECIPLIREGPPVYFHEVEIHENADSVHVLTPELNPERELSSVVELIPEVNPQYPSNLDEMLTDHMYPHRPSSSVYIAEPISNSTRLPRQNWLSLEEEPLGQNYTEEEDSLLPMSQLPTHSYQRIPARQYSLDSTPQESSCPSMQSDYIPPSEINHSQPVEMEEDGVLEPIGKGPNSGSDQGYISKMSSQPEPPFKEDPLVALRRLQEELFQNCLPYSDIDPEGY
ncbi:interleukin 17 receptor A1a isoform X2 [Plectropomus leopardus]|uniref:interleukin 17 receptor A1a isoform X2 n=1 Tax=Plectropomus leopardus TaxID=160734 RepID=UPI001C4D7932|nr:interleukin 17 receptor A1a isoform X2 [Plectropomus leopardus]